MATRTIVTSQPDVACDVCARRLLRGEQPDTFIAAGRRLTVCELCAPRATHEGWLRESEHAGLALPHMRPRRGRSLIDRLRQVARGQEQPVAREQPMGAADYDEEGAGAPYDLLSGYEEEGVDADAQVPLSQPASLAPPYLEEALAVFNASEFPRRVAGVARSLGPPVVNVRSAEHLDSVVRIVVAWELCWYRYEVDLSEELAGAVVLAQGTELSELEQFEHEGNASALPTGLLALALSAS
ncbi:MAG TPA: hypothetical protein VGG08_04030 [Solirubrobacteraceae bacterium]|jgi:hypothetical protein